MAEAKKIDLVAYLAKLGHHPVKVRGNDCWYRSPLREEKTASFKVNRKGNVWYDHGNGQGGNIIDFAILYHNCTTKEVLEKLDSRLSFHQQETITAASTNPLIKIISERSLMSLHLLRYIRHRRIAEVVARKYCREATFTLNGKTNTAISFPNNEGGFELRNQWFKGSASPKAITSFENGSKELAVFEGFFDFLSHETIQQNSEPSDTNFLILNSTAFFEKCRELMDRHDSVRLFLDRDKGGQKCTAQALAWARKFRDESHLYKGYNDLNEWMQQISKGNKQGLRQGR